MILASSKGWYKKHRLKMHCLIYFKAIALYNVSFYSVRIHLRKLRTRSARVPPNRVIFHYDYVADYISIFPWIVKHLDATMCKELTSGFKLCPPSF